jgi:putative acetyltransferase
LATLAGLAPSQGDDLTVEQVHIEEAHTGPLLAAVRVLFEEYAASLAQPDAVAELNEELPGLPGRYAPPAGRLLVALYDEAPVGCVALRPLSDGAAEMKRLYVRPGFRGARVGRLLVERLIEETRAAGYRCIRLDTLPTMNEARVLYQSLGFRPIPPYGSHPLHGAMFLELDLNAGR